MASRTLIAVHASSITSTALQAFTLESERAEAPSAADADVLPEHATETSVLCDAQAHILLRLINNRRTIELLSLSTPISPIRFLFPSPVLPSPAVVYDNDEVHVVACTQAGSVFRLVFPLPDLWNTQYMTKNWRQEYHIRHPIANLLGPVHVKEAGCMLIALRDGGILELDASRKIGNAEFQGNACSSRDISVASADRPRFSRLAGDGSSATSFPQSQLFHAVQLEATAGCREYHLIFLCASSLSIVDNIFLTT